MKLNDLIRKKSESLRGDGPRSNIAVSTRVRIARNIKEHVYFNRASDKQREKTLSMVFSAMKKSSFLENALFIKLRDISDLDRLFLVERHLMSPEHMQEGAHKGLVIEEKEIVSVMLNEEDHIRLQVLQSGFNIMEAWRIVDDIDTELGQHLSFDYSSRFGYMTSCPTNTGTGLRASVMLHLSALALAGQIDNVFGAISKLGLTMRGFYGEGTEALGDFFQISNQIALGHSEMDILDNLERIINKIISREEAMRENLVKKRKHEISDRIYRSYGTLKSARIITSNETIKLLSTIRLGVELGLVKDVDPSSINEMLLITQPAHLQKLDGKEIAPYKRDIKRADLIREKLKILNKK
ncbi:MAG: protein arginine kinase [Candidatus Omnitrophota bacterium]|nr:protein arginine kinase [Candidatus Omnitrophota bacterium]